MKISLISLIVALVVLVSFANSASADYSVETYKNVTEVTVHVQGYKKPYTKTFKLSKPSTIILKPCPDGFQSNCLYVVGKKGKEKEYFSFTADDLNWISYKTVTTVATR